MKKSHHINPKTLSFPLRKNIFGVIDITTNRSVIVTNTCPINSLIHGFSHLEATQSYLTKITSKSVQPEIINLSLSLVRDGAIDNGDFYKFIDRLDLATSKSTSTISCYGFVSVVLSKVLESYHELSCNSCGTTRRLW